MGDSDDDFGRRKNRDRFSKDRNDALDRRHDYGERRAFGSGSRDYRSFRSRNDYSPPTSKRTRREWDEGAYDSPPKKDDREDSSSATSPMLTFKQFLATQDDMISDEDALHKYKEYKLEYHKQQLHAFFLLHKDQEWFRVKYHPEESLRKRNEHQAGIKRRLDVFMELKEKGWVTRCSLDQDSAENLIKLMDGVVVKLEGGADEDLDVIEKSHCLEENEEQSASRPKESEGEEEDTLEAVVEASTEGQTAENSAEEQANGKANESDGEISGHESDKEDGSLPLKNEGKGLSADKVSLHRTSSIFLRNLPPTITRQEVEALFKRYPGYLRIALAEPLQERRFYRRGWVSFRRDVNVKEICWNLSSVRVKDCDLGAIVNRDLTRRIRAINGITGHKVVMQSDLRNVARLVQMYDKRLKLWTDDTSESAKDDEGAAEMHGFKEMGRNPLMANITDYLVEEVSAEEDELLGTGNEDISANGSAKVPFERDEKLAKALDPLLLYLRVVHSVDYYNHGEYPNEDEMPNRCGLIHVRGLGPTVQGDQTGGTVSVQFVNEFIRNFEMKLQPLLTGKERLSEEEVDKLGKKDPDKEVEAFISANCQELAKDKWLCPLSGKKFKGPEFVRKHIFNKHPEKLQEVRLEAEYFNNYLYDPKRPFLVETRQQQSQSGSGDRTGGSERYHQTEYGRQGGSGFGNDRGFGDRGFASGGGFHRQSGSGNYGRRDYQRRDYGQQRSHGGNRFFNEGRKDSRVPMAYTDLDAPDEVY